jgi:ribosomal protein L12E/L44/L45/RPP1/RPP2
MLAKTNMDELISSIGSAPAPGAGGGGGGGGGGGDAPAAEAKKEESDEEEEADSTFCALDHRRRPFCGVIHRNY